eukprot:scpid60333/ scgid16040/ Arylsulfatase G
MATQRAALCLTLCVVLFTDASHAASQPNFIVMFADDTGWGDLGANWPQTTDTPRLDAMAKSGTLMADWHAGASVCTPSRAALLTGRLGRRTGVIHNFNPTSRGGLPLNETTIAETLKEAGYRTGMIGKWHLGVEGKFHPFYRGFDSYYGLPYSNDMGCTDTPGFNKPMMQPCCKDSKSNIYSADYQRRAEAGNCSKSLAVPLYHNATIIEQPVDLETLATRYGDRAEEFIADNSTEPFLLYMAFAHMHVPQNHAKQFDNVSKTGGEFGNTLRELDWTVGRVLDALEKNSKSDNTLVIFTTDNGPWETKCNLTGSKGPFVGEWQRTTGGGGGTGKFTTWEGGHRAPTVVHWPGHVPANRVSHALASSLDIFPTLVSMAGAKMPQNRMYDGLDLTDVLLNGNDSAGHTHLFHPNSGAGKQIGNLTAMRIGQYKIFFETAGTGDCHQKSGNGRVGMYHDPPLIFDLSADIAEAHPLTATHAQYQTVVSKALKLHSAVLADIATDNTTVVDYGSDAAHKPCCNSNNVCCRCTD